MGTVTIPASGGADFEIYGEQEAAVIYHSGSSRPSSVAWVAATADTQARTLVDATRVVDELSFAGTETAPGVQPLSWPRTGVTYADGTPVLDSGTPIAVEQAVYELAALLLAKPGIFDASTQDSNIESVTAGSVSVSFFAPVTVGKLPPVVLRLLRWFLASSATATGGTERLGSEEESAFDDCDRYRIR